MMHAKSYISYKGIPFYTYTVYLNMERIVHLQEFRIDEANLAFNVGVNNLYYFCIFLPKALPCPEPQMMPN